MAGFTDSKIVVKRAQVAFITNETFGTELQDIYALAMPNRNIFRKNEDKMADVFDSTAINSTTRFANRLSAELTPAFQTWGWLRVGPAVQDEDKITEINKELDPITLQCHAAFMAGGFITAANEMYQDLAAGQGAMAIMPGDDTAPVRYTSFPQAETATESGHWGKTIGLHIRKKIPASQIMSYWPGAVLPAALTKLAEDPKKNKQDMVNIFISYIWVDGDNWEYHVIWEDKGEPLLQKHFGFQPFVAPRWSKLSGEERGRGPLHLALPDIKTLNKVKELLLMNAALSIVGIYTAVDDGVLNPNTVRITPGAIIAVGSNGTGFKGPSLQQLPTGREFDVSQLLIQDLQLSIKKIMLDDQLPSEQSAVRSPTEIIELMKQLSQDTGAAFGRLYDEFIVVLFKSTIAILKDKSIIQSKAELKIDNVNFKIQVTSPLAKIQDIQDLESIIQYLSISTQFFGEDETLIATKMDELNAFLAEKLGVPAKFKRSEDERATKRQEIADARAAEAQTAAPPEPTVENPVPAQ